MPIMYMYIYVCVYIYTHLEKLLNYKEFPTSPIPKRKEKNTIVSRPLDPFPNPSKASKEDGFKNPKVDRCT